MSFEAVDLDETRWPAAEPGTACEGCGCEIGPDGWCPWCQPRSAVPGIDRPVLLGVELPGPHSVLAYGGLWKSWGDWHDPADWPDAVVEEAWTVTW